MRSSTAAISPIRSEARRAARFRDRACATCGETFTPTGPNCPYCPTCRPRLTRRERDTSTRERAARRALGVVGPSELVTRQLRLEAKVRRVRALLEEAAILIDELRGGRPARAFRQWVVWWDRAAARAGVGDIAPTSTSDVVGSRARR